MSKTSELYEACRDGNLNKVENLLKKLSLNEINRIEQNGSTALHAACQYGHLDIARILLEHGALRRQANTNNKTPEDEARTDEIKSLFQRSPIAINERFVSKMPDLEWMITGPEGFQIACDNIYLSKKFNNLEEAKQNICNATELHDAQGMDQVIYLLNKAEQTNDITCLICAYTAETDFYRILNYCNAQLRSCQYTEEERDTWFVKFGKTLHKSEQLDKYRWMGTTYRGIRMTNKDLDQYKVGDYIVNKAFLSTSKSRHIAEQFISISFQGQLSVICIYHLKKDEYVLDISSISEYPQEQEVLILPNACFKVEKINRNVHPIEIELSSW